MNHETLESEYQSLDVKGVLQRHGINPTTQRVIIAKVLLSKFDHLSAEQVMSAVNQEKVKVSKATIYNTLKLFVEKGLVHPIIIDPNKVFYDSNITSHYHVYNEDTGDLIDLAPGAFEINGLPKLPGNTVISGIDIIVRVKNR